MYLVVDERLVREHPSWTAGFDELVDLEGGGTWAARATAELLVRVDSARVCIDGEIAAEVPRVCDLCLAHYLHAVEASVAELCLIEGEDDEAAAGAVASWDEDNEVWRIGLGGRLDLTEMVRQAILLALPTQSRCGLDDDPAGPDEEPGGSALDPRWAALQALMSKGEDDGRPKT